MLMTENKIAGRLRMVEPKVAGESMDRVLRIVDVRL